MTDRLDAAVKAHYEGQALPEDRLDAILARGRDQVRGTPDRTWYARLAAMAAVLLLGFGLFHVWFQERDLTDRVLAEIAMNHLKELTVEVASTSYAEVQKSLDRLDVPILPPGPLRARYTLIGGRYCSIQGGIAAQLKLRDRESGDVRTLYATRLTDELAGIAPHEGDRDDVSIRLWQQGDVFFGLAGAPAD